MPSGRPSRSKPVRADARAPVGDRHVASATGGTRSSRPPRRRSATPGARSRPSGAGPPSICTAPGVVSSTYWQDAARGSVLPAASRARTANAYGAVAAGRRGRSRAGSTQTAHGVERRAVAPERALEGGAVLGGERPGRRAAAAERARVVADRRRRGRHAVERGARRRAGALGVAGGVGRADGEACSRRRARRPGRRSAGSCRRPTARTTTGPRSRRHSSARAVLGGERPGRGRAVADRGRATR